MFLIRLYEESKDVKDAVRFTVLFSAVTAAFVFWMFLVLALRTIVGWIAVPLLWPGIILWVISAITIITNTDWSWEKAKSLTRSSRKA